MYREPDYEAIAKRPLSQSALKEFAISPQHYIEYLNSPFKPSEQMVLGSLVDLMIFFPEEWQEKCRILPIFDNKLPPDKNGTVKNNLKKNELDMIAWLEKLAVEEKEMKEKDKNFFKFLIVDQAQVDTAKIMVAQVTASEPAQWLLNQMTEVQDNLFWEDQKTGLKLRGILDCRGGMDEGNGIICDLKSARSADPDEFLRQVINLGYDVQVGMYRHAAKAKWFKFPEFYFLVVENTAPYGVSVLRLEDEFLEYCDKKVRFLLDSFALCLKEKQFHRTYDFRVIGGKFNLRLPGWLRSKLEVWE